MHVDHTRNLLLQSIDDITSPESIRMYVPRPDMDMTRNRLLPAKRVAAALLNFGAHALEVELSDEFGNDPAPSPSALSQRLDLLSPRMMYDLHQTYTRSLYRAGGRPPKWIHVLIDGSNFSFTDYDGRDLEPWRRISKKGGTSILQGHLTIAKDASRDLILDAVIQPLHKTNEYRAMTTMIDRLEERIPKGSRAIIIADRGFPSWNTIAHAQMHGHCFVIRTKDRKVERAILAKLPLPENDEFDVHCRIQLVRSAAAQAQPVDPDVTVVRLPRQCTLDYIESDSDDALEVEVRVVRCVLPNGEYMSLITNLPESSFPTQAIPALYKTRWGVELTFGHLKSALAMESFHGRRPRSVMHEVYARLMMYNYVATIKREADRQLAEKQKRCGGQNKYIYVVDFSSCAHEAKKYLRDDSIGSEEFIRRITKHRHAVRADRPDPPRGQTQRQTPIANTHRPAV